VPKKPEIELIPLNALRIAAAELLEPSRWARCSMSVAMVAILMPSFR
jgi:hypothetical protein